MADQAIKDRLEYLRGRLRAENISYGELHELQSLAEHIDPGDVELLEPAGVPEFPQRDKENSTLDGEVVAACRWCGTAIYLSARTVGPMVGGTGPGINEHWRHIEVDTRHCVGGNGTVAEPYDGTGPIAEKLRAIQAKDDWGDPSKET